MAMQKRLKKGRDRILFGVCSGLAEYLDVDPTIVRLIFLIAFVIEPKIIFVYLILAVIMPENGGYRYDEKKTKKVLAYGLIGLGLLIILKGILPILFTSGLLGLILIIAGLILLRRWACS